MFKNIYPHINNCSTKKYKVTVVLFIYFLLLQSILIAQRANNWYFPEKKSLTFNTTPPSFIGNSQCSESGAASVSDNNGKLLFYSDGKRVFNKNSQIMPNGNNLNGGIAPNNGITGNRALVIPHPGLQNLYYLFTNEANQGVLPTGYYYHLIDMNANGGLGDIILKNQLLYGNSGMRMTAVPMADGLGYWLITMEYRRKILRNYKITCLGLDLSPVIDTLDANFIGNSNTDGGDMKASSSGNFIACGYSFGFGNGITELYKFNKTTGKVNQKLTIPLLSFEREFSPSDEYLYIAGAQPNSNVIQFNILSMDSMAIFNTRTIIGQGTGIQLGPDGRIYTLNIFDSLFSIIDKPDLPFPFCNFVSRVIPIEGVSSGGSFVRILPFFVPSLIASPNVQIPSYTLASNCRTVTLTGKTYIKGNNLSFKWMFGDGDSTIQIVPSMGDTTFTTVTHTYPLGKDTFNVQLFVTSDTVCGLGSAGKQVIVKPPPPIAKFGVSNLCNNLSVQFSDSSLLNFNPSISYQWQFFTKNNVLLGSSNAQNPSFTFPAYDSFNVRLIARSFLSCVEADTITKTIILKSKPTASFTYNNSCGSTSASFINSSFVTADTLSSYYWSFGGGNTSTQKNPSFSFAGFGSYPVKLVVTSSQGCVSDTFSMPVNIKEKPVASFIYNNNGCVGAPVLLQDNSTITTSSINQYYWQLPSGASFNTSTINPTFTVGNNYNIKYAVTSALGCTSDTINQAINIENIPVAAIAAPTNTCVTQPITLNSSSSITFGTINNWSWQLGTQTSSNQNANFTITTPGLYTASLTVTSKNGCVSNTATAPITIETTPISSFTNGVACVGVPVTFTNTSTNVFGAITTTRWLVNNGFISNNPTSLFYTFTQKGNYQVQLQNTTVSGCTSTETKNITVDHAIANAGKDFSAIENEPFILQGSGGVNYNWHPPTGLSDTSIANPTGILSKNQTYKLKITTLQGCVGYDTINITILRKLIIPNAFSPNNDGINDFWTIEQLKDYPNAQIQIFNRAGQLMHSTRNNTIIWNGKINNQPVPIGAYYYIINLNNSLVSKPFSGVVMVVR
jgi:gliding motility-associated-like protein